MAVMTYCQLKQAQSFSFWTRTIGLSVLVHALGISFWIKNVNHNRSPLEMVSHFNVVLETQQKSNPKANIKEIKAKPAPIKKPIKKVVRQRMVSVKPDSKLKSSDVIQKQKPEKKSLAVREVEDEKVILEEQVAFVSPRISTDIDNRKPYYPQVARRRGMQGNVVLHVSVGTQGEVLEIVIKQSSGYLILDEAAKDAIRQWQFQPAQRNGKVEIGYIEIPIRFNLKKS